jgi:RHS repeat-associated protein
MLKYLIASLFLLAGIVNKSLGQFSVTATNYVWEGGIGKYNIRFDEPPPPGLNLGLSVSGGTIVSQNINPYANNAVTVFVKWDCGASSGTITLTNANPAINFTYNVDIWTYGSYPDFCNGTKPETQPVVYGAVPTLLQVDNCSPYCASYYGFTYQWQEATVADYFFLPWVPNNWLDIAGANAATYQPAPQYTYGVKAYRRITSFINGGSPASVYSKPAFVSFTDFLNAGSISGGGTVNFEVEPIIVQTPASLGQCYPANYTYTWERSVEGGAWEIIGTGVDYPMGKAIIGDCAIRRSVLCGGQLKYTDPIYFKISYTSPFTENMNYVRTNLVTIPGVRSWPQADQLATGDKVQQTVYLDGFGRQLQEVTKQGSLKNSNLDPNLLGNYQDLVVHHAYDGLGREGKNYPAYATNAFTGMYKPDAATEQVYLTNALYGEPAGSPYTSSSTQYDNSPLNRVVNTKLPGNGWNTNPLYKGVSNDFAFNSLTDDIRIWTIGYGSGPVPFSPAAYGDKMLVLAIMKDDRDRLVVEYKDRAGLVVLKKVQEAATASTGSYIGWLSTFYVYDDFGRLRYTISPKAVQEMRSAANWTITPAIKKGLCFYQEYDEKGHIVVKHSPDAGDIQSVYDNRDRLVLSQDENQRTRGQWSYSLYDEEDRPVITGLFNDGRNRAAMEAFVKSPSFVTAGNKRVQLFTGANETFIVYNPIAGTDAATGSNMCSTCTITTVNTASYYDRYPAGSFAYQPVSNTDFPPTNNSYIQPLQPTQRTRSMATGGKVRVLNERHDDGIVGNDDFMASTVYYDERATVLQKQANNIKQGIDISSVQKNFNGEILGTHSRHRSATGQYNNFIVASRSDYDLLHRPLNSYLLLTMSAADIGNLSKYKLLNSVKYDALGRVKTKAIGANPSSPGQPLETQDFTYDIQGRLTGVNKDYTTAMYPGNPGYGQWERRFGYVLGYDNADGRFTAPQFGSSATGVQWRSQGDNTPRRYNYTYDNVGRFTSAVFTQIDGFGTGPTQWGSNNVDLGSSVGGYDANGNIQSLQQKGIQPGTIGGQLIDDMTYQYRPQSSQLYQINEAAFGGSDVANGKQGDYKNGASIGSNDRYGYDGNGNTLFDKSKGITDASAAQGSSQPGMVYNYLNLPQKLTVWGKSVTDYVYDAVGNRLAKKTTQLTAGAAPPKTTYHVGNFVYEDNDLQYILTGFGQLRVIDPVAAWSGPSGTVNYLERRGNIPLVGGKWGVWDYFVQDHLGNTRMVLTEEFQQQQLYCSMEANPAVTALEEQSTFGQVGGNNEVATTRTPNPNPTAWPGHVQVSRLLRVDGPQQKGIGPNVLLKVMAGDQLSGAAEYYYENASGNNTVNQTLFGVIGNGIAAIIGGGNAPVSTGIKDNIVVINAGLSLPTGGFGQFTSAQPNLPANTPRAYLNYIFFDEQFKYVSQGSGAVPVDALGAANSKQGLLSMGVLAPKNGYAYIYLSNESTNIPVYFDDFRVAHTRGAIVEDNAYYAHGLKIVGISATAALKPNTRYGYQGTTAEIDEASGYNEFAMRHYNPQIGRWMQADPVDVASGMYNAMSNNPANVIDPDGARPQGFYIRSEGGGAIFWDAGNNDNLNYMMFGGERYDFLAEWYYIDKGPGTGLFKVEYDGYSSSGFMQIRETPTSYNEYLQSALIRKYLYDDLSSVFVDCRTAYYRFSDGFRSALENTVEGIWDFATDKAWKGQTWVNIANLLPNNNTPEAIFAKAQIGKSIINGVKNIPNWDAQDWGSFTGNVVLVYTGGEVAKGFSAVEAVGAVDAAKATEVLEAASTAGKLDGSFSIWNWEGYPSSIPKPNGPFRLLAGEEYAAARSTANKANKALSKELELPGKFVDIHEMHPVKFGGSPTNINNKLFLDRTFHQTQVTPFWNRIMNGIQ